MTIYLPGHFACALTEQVNITSVELFRSVDSVKHSEWELTDVAVQGILYTYEDEPFTTFQIAYHLKVSLSMH
jgi:hypothetical protein